MGEKTEKASSKKRKDERKKGNIFQSKDVVTISSVLAIFLFLRFYMPMIYNTLSESLSTSILEMSTHTEMTQSFMTQVFKDFVVDAAITIIPLALVSIVIAIIATGVQTKFLFSMESLKPKFSKLNPFKGIKNMVSLKSLVELFKNMIKVSIITYMIYAFVEKKYATFAKALDTGLIQTTVFLFNSILEMVLQIVMIFIAVAAFDFFYQWWDYEKNMKMTKQETKEEYKQTEGDPKIKGAIKERQRKMSNARMMQAVPTADVIIRNPTHFAVALKYDIDKDEAPIVVAKGQDRIALKIVEIAQQNGVHTIENKPLARALYAQSEINGSIPFEHFSAVAEILALVYKLKGKVEQ